MSRLWDFRYCTRCDLVVASGRDSRSKEGYLSGQVIARCHCKCQPGQWSQQSYLVQRGTEAQLETHWRCRPWCRGGRPLIRFKDQVVCNASFRIGGYAAVRDLRSVSVFHTR